MTSSLLGCPEFHQPLLESQRLTLREKGGERGKGGGGKESEREGVGGERREG